jgi:hypothetical protein
LSIKVLEKYFTSFALYRRNEPAPGTWGSPTYVLQTGNYKGFIQPISGNENLQDGKSGEKATHRLYTYVNTSVQYGDKIVQGGQNYFVIYAIQPAGISGVGHHKEIIMGVFE